MYGAIVGDLAGFPYEFTNAELTDEKEPLLRALQPGGDPRQELAGEIFSEKTVLTAALQEGLLSFEKKIPGLLSGKRADVRQRRHDAAGGDAAGLAGRGASAGEGGGRAGSDASAQGASGKERGTDARGLFERTAAEEITGAMRKLGRAYPLAGYSMDLSIWLFREDSGPADGEDPGPAARVSPVAWMFQDDLYMMRRMAVLQAGLTHTDRETLKASDAAASAVFLAIHRCTKDYIAGYLEKNFRYRVNGFDEMREELMLADSTPSLCVRAALTAFLYGTDFEDVLRRAVSLCGSRTDTAAVAAIAGSMGEAYFGIPDSLKETCRRMLPEEIRLAADAFEARMEAKKEARRLDPELMARWESALTRATENHPAAVQGNEPLEQAIGVMLEKKDQQSLIQALQALRLRTFQNGRVLVPVTAAGRTEKSDPGPGEGSVRYRLQALRTRDGRLWQPAFTSREELEKAGTYRGLVLSWSLDSLLRRYLDRRDDGTESGEQGEAKDEGAKIPAIAGIVFNPGGRIFFVPRATIAVILEKGSAD